MKRADFKKEVTTVGPNWAVGIIKKHTKKKLDIAKECDIKRLL